MTKRHIVIATRKSPLALKQSELVGNALQTLYPHLSIGLLDIATKADINLHFSLEKMGGKEVFVKELEDALLSGEADIAVHSMKDVPMDLPPGLCLPAMLPREDVRDAFISNRFQSFGALPFAASVGTSSLRRRSQLLALRKDLSFHPLRGNITTRLNTLNQNTFDAIILAVAGLKRMGLTERIRNYLSVDDSLPAAGQGAIGIECRLDDEHMQALMKPLNHQDTFIAVSAERALCKRLGGGCSVPVAAYAHLHKQILHVRGLVPNRLGTRIIRANRAGSPKDAVHLGERLAEELLQLGALSILKEYQS